ncbi:hypothetical protein GCM10010840_36260 [Deinococcus aerolatus]|uniref:Polymorphic outer membrane protein n=1 Tax=Deinococcus aerolatus TaxID=522487 RepID=A0ABQ2GGY4_9DEIO|nr:hypothetical protein [Deinococcus aerolatus]GGL94958.1 hypothetical protein GCM10010840_36260 [Deinococcus aerolatus]
MRRQQHTAGLALVSLTLVLAACGGGTVDPPLPGTPVTSLADSGPGTLRELLGSAKAGDTLRLDSGTITLAGPLKLTKSVTLNLGSGVIDAAGKGRALEVPSGVTVTIKGGTLKGGTGAPITVASIGKQDLSVATYGGVLLNEGTLTLDGTAITGGEANVGGGIANLKTGTLTLKGTNSVSGNAAKALPAGATESNGHGAGISNAGVLKMEGGKVTSNVAVYAGGGIFNFTGGLVTISGGSVDNNQCTSPNITTADGTEGCGGGGIYSFGDVTLTGGNVNGNTATYYGGGIVMVRNAASDPRPVLAISGGSVDGNKTTGSIDTGGGGIWSNQIIRISGGTVKGNSSGTGGGINNWGDLTVSGGAIDNNLASRYGGGIQLSQATRLFQMTGGSVSGNSAILGGGGINSDASMTLSGGSIQNNTTDGSGGGISMYVQTGRTTTTTLEGTLVIGGNKARIGGGINTGNADRKALTLNIKGGKITGNQAIETGGGVLVGGQVNMTGGEISGNAVTGRMTAQNQGGGGGVRLYSGSAFTASGGSIKDNTAWFGGGVFVGGAYQTSPEGDFVLAGATVSGNQATDTNVGGGFFNDGKLTITSGSVTGNTAPSNGGGVFNRKNATYVQPGGSVTGNNPDDVFSEK